MVEGLAHQSLHMGHVIDAARQHANMPHDDPRNVVNRRAHIWEFHTLELLYELWGRVGGPRTSSSGHASEVFERIRQDRQAHYESGSESMQPSDDTPRRGSRRQQVGRLEEDVRERKGHSRSRSRGHRRKTRRGD